MVAKGDEMADLLLRPESQAVRLLRSTQHGLFAAVVAVGFVKGLQGSNPVATSLVTVALAGWYVVGLYLERNRRSIPVAIAWLVVLTGLCVGALFVSADFAWVSFALFVLYASVLPSRIAYVSIAALAICVGAVLALHWPSDRHWAAQFIGPLMGAAAAAGLVSVYRTAAAESRERQLLIDELLATQDSLARANLDAGVRSERERVAAEIHDTLAQGFASVVMVSRQGLKATESGDTDLVRTRLSDLERIGAAGLDDARRLVRNLAPSELDAHGLVDAIGALADQVTRRFPAATCEVSVRVDGEPRALADDVETALLRVAQEGVTNALKHSDAARVVVTLTYDDDHVHLDVVDDGSGFAVDQIQPGSRSRGGFGLGVMKRRIGSLGGSLTVESSPGGGTAVSASVPVETPVPAPTDAAPADTTQSEEGRPDE
ncbi:MAG: sensor histidine kinase [Microthrixaceae bacterium]|nr:sensor histidine kinase [Microthrixaceae bacterium]